MEIKRLVAIALIQLLPGGLSLSDTMFAGLQPPAPVERQLTHDPKGHTLNNTQVFSPDDQWLVYDTRNLDTQLGQTCCIEMVNTGTGEIRTLYQTTNQTEYGPGVGAATFCPIKPAVLFLHELRNANAQHPYALTRRTGVLVNLNQPGKPHFLDGRDTTPPFTPGALRGGTHAHQWSDDGQRISFTYNDAVLEQRSRTDSSMGDLRTVGVLSPVRSVPVRASNGADAFGASGLLPS